MSRYRKTFYCRMNFPNEFWYSIAIIHFSWFHNMNSPIYNCRFSCCMLCVLFTALCNGETWIYFKCSWFLWKKSKEYARCVLNFCIVTYFGITTYLVYVCYMIVAIKPMYFVMYKIIYFCWKTFSVKSQYHNTKYMYHNHNLHSSASWNFLFPKFLRCSANWI